MILFPVVNKALVYPCHYVARKIYKISPLDTPYQIFVKTKFPGTQVFDTLEHIGISKTKMYKLRLAGYFYLCGRNWEIKMMSSGLQIPHSRHKLSVILP